MRGGWIAPPEQQLAAVPAAMIWSGYLCGPARAAVPAVSHGPGPGGQRDLSVLAFEPAATGLAVVGLGHYAAAAPFDEPAAGLDAAVPAVGLAAAGPVVGIFFGPAVGPAVGTAVGTAAASFSCRPIWQH